MRVYTVHLRRPGPDEDLVFVREGFNVWAFVFCLLWALWNRLWLFGALAFGSRLALVWTAHWVGLNAAGEGALVLAHALAVGYLANDMRRRRLDSLGYRNMGAVAAPDLDGAAARFLDGHPMVAAQMNAAQMSTEGRA